MQPLPAGACSFWHRQVYRHVDDEGFGIRAQSLMTEAQIDRQDAAREEEDRKDPPCGKCVCCIEHANSGDGPE